MFSRNSFENLQPEISSFLLLRVTFSGLQIINVNSDDVDKSSFPGAIDRRWKEKEKGADYWEPTSFRGFSPTRPYGARETTLRRENLGTRLTANVVGREGLATEGEGRRTPRPSFFAKRRLRSQLRRLFAELLGSYQCGFCTQEEAMSITCFILCRLSTYLVKVCRSKPLVKKSDTVISSVGEGSCCQ